MSAEGELLALDFDQFKQAAALKIRS